MAFKSSIQLMLFYMQSKELYKLTPQLCRLAKKEYKERIDTLPEDVRVETAFDNLIQMIEFLQKSEYARSMELLGDAFKEWEELLKYSHVRIAKVAAGEIVTDTEMQMLTEEPPTVFEDRWQPPSGPPPPYHAPKQEAVHPLNEDDIRNWDAKSPEFHLNKQKQNGEIHNSSPQQSGDDDVYDRKTYFTTLRPRDDQPDYQSVYVTCSPRVLSDRFSELYKTEWKAAYHELSGTLGDKQSVRHMLWIIAKSSIICATFATQQLQDMENSAVGIAVSKDPLNKKVLVEEPLPDPMQKIVVRARNLLVDYRREIAKLSVPMLQKEIRQAIVSELGTSLPRRYTGVGNHFVEYANSCIELIWLMYVHDPPMHLEWLTHEQEGADFQTELYEPYTATGKHYDFCVWPVVRLHKGGPVLTKGVAQARSAPTEQKPLLREKEEVNV